LISLFLFLLILYVALFPRPLGKELLVRPMWTTVLPTVAAPSAEPGQQAPPQKSVIANSGPVSGKLREFRLGNRFGYIDGAGTIHYLDNVRYGLALGEDRFVNYPRVSPRIDVEDPSGATVISINQDGYPVYIHNRLYVLSPDQTEISEYDRNGKPLWQKQLGGIITAVAAGTKLTVIGLLDGSFEAVNQTGKAVFRDEPAGSSVPIILGIAVSDAEDHIAVVSGLNPQMLTIYERSGDQYIASQSRRLLTDFRHPVSVECVAGTSNVAYEAGKGVDIFSITDRRTASVEIPGVLHSLLPERVQGLLVAGALHGSRRDSGSNGSGEGGHAKGAFADLTTAEVLLFMPDGRAVFRLRFPGSSLYLSADGTRLLWGVDDTFIETDLTIG